MQPVRYEILEICGDMRYYAGCVWGMQGRYAMAIVETWYVLSIHVPMYIIVCTVLICACMPDRVADLMILDE